MREKVDDVAGNLVGVLVRRGKHVVAVALVGLHHGNHLGRVHAQIGLADAVVRMGHVDGHAAWRNGGAVVDVVHALHLGGGLGIDFEDHLVGNLQPGLVVAHGRSGDQQTVCRHAQHLDHRNVQGAEKAKPCVLGDVRQVHVDEVDLARVDLVAADGVGVERQALAQGVGRGQGAIKLGGGRSAGPEVDLVGFAGGMLGLGVGCKGLGHGLGVAGTSETTHADVGASGDERRSLFGRHDAFKKGRVAYPIGQRHGENSATVNGRRRARRARQIL